MKYVTLLCAMGMSTSLLVNKMKDAAKNREKKLRLWQWRRTLSTRIMARQTYC